MFLCIGPNKDHQMRDARCLYALIPTNTNNMLWKSQNWNQTNMFQKKQHKDRQNPYSSNGGMQVLECNVSAVNSWIFAQRWPVEEEKQQGDGRTNRG